jgi:cytochrome c oxidase subunit 2
LFLTSPNFSKKIQITYFYVAFAYNTHPPSNVETINSTGLHLTEEFAEDNLGVKTNSDGSLTVTMVAKRYGIYPQHLELPTDTPIKFRFATPIPAWPSYAKL